MVVFQHNLIFVDEPQFGDETVDDTQESIFIREKSYSYLQDRYVEYSEWVELFGQKARYHTTLPLEKSIVKFSWALEIKDIFLLCWDSKERTICYIKGRDYSSKRLQFWIFHTFFPMILELEQIYNLLHVGAVEIDDKAILLSAPSFGGKSTLTEYFLNRGNRVLSDDSLAVERRGDLYYAIPSYPFCRPYRELESLGIFREDFADKPRVISAIFKLQRVEPDSDINIYKVRGVEKFKALYQSRFIDFSSMRLDHYSYYSKMANSVDIYQIDIPWEKRRLDEVYRELITFL